MESFLEIIVSVRSALNEHVVFAVGFLLFVGYFFGKFAQRLKLPAISGYIIAGLILGDSVCGIISAKMTFALHTVTEIALGIVAITIGGEFSYRKIRRLGGRIIIITIFEILGAFIFVSLAMRLLSWPLYYSILFGSIAAATAPAATVVIIQELRARGEFVDTIYGVVAMDDAGCVILFAATFALFGTVLNPGAQDIGFAASVAKAATEICVAAGIGVLGGIVLFLVTFRTESEREMLILSLATVMLTNAVSVQLGVSLLIANMMTGATLVNISKHGNRVLRSLGPVTPPIYASFFTIAGTELKIVAGTGILVFLHGIAYVVSRGFGKYLGFFTGGLISGSSKRVRKYIGFCGIPQAGVAIGLAMFLKTSPIVASAGADIKAALAQMANIILFAVLLNELIGPPLSKYGITRGS